MLLPPGSDNECWVVQQGKKVRLGMPACLTGPGPLPPGPPSPPVRPISVSEEDWLVWRQQQLDTLTTAEEKVAARGADAGASPRAPIRVPPSPRAGSAGTAASAGTGTAPLVLEQRFVDRAALLKGVTFGPEAFGSKTTYPYRQHRR